MNLRYEVRNSIENAVKSQNIDRSRFHEVSKYRYENIIRQFYYTFFEHKDEEYLNIKDLNLKYLRFRKNLKEHFVFQYECEWEEYFSNMKDVIDEKEEKEYYLILDYGWVYEGYLTEICDVLLNADGPPFIEDFYIISKKFEWIIYHCDDGQCMCIVKK